MRERSFTYFAWLCKLHATQRNYNVYLPFLSLELLLRLNINIWWLARQHGASAFGLVWFGLRPGDNKRRSYRKNRSASTAASTPSRTQDLQPQRPLSPTANKTIQAPPNAPPPFPSRNKPPTTTIVVATAPDRKAKAAQDLAEAEARVEELEDELEGAKAHVEGLRAKLGYLEGRPAGRKEPQRPLGRRRILPDESDDEELVPQ